MSRKRELIMTRKSKTNNECNNYNEFWNKSKKNSKRSEKSKKEHIENKSIVSLNFTINEFIIILISLIKVLALSDNETYLIYTKFSNITLKIKGNGTKNILGHESGASFSSGSYPKYI